MCSRSSHLLFIFTTIVFNQTSFHFHVSGCRILHPHVQTLLCKVKSLKKCSSIYLRRSRGVENSFHVRHKLVEPHLVSLLLKEKRSNMTGGAYLCSLPSISHWATQAWLTRKSPRQAENSYETPQLNPCWNIRASVPPAARLSNSARPSSTSTTAFQRQRRCLGNALWLHPGPICQSNTWEGILAFYQAHPRRETATKNPSSSIMSWWSLKIILAPIFEVRRSGPIRIQPLFFCFYQHSIIKYWSGWKRSQNFLLTSANITKQQWWKRKGWVSFPIEDNQK